MNNVTILKEKIWSLIDRGKVNADICKIIYLENTIT
jgi:hypothetical protein